MFALLYYGEDNSLDGVSEDSEKLKQKVIELNGENNGEINWVDKGDGEWCGYVGNLDVDGESDTLYVIERVEVI